MQQKFAASQTRAEELEQQLARTTEQLEVAAAVEQNLHATQDEKFRLILNQISALDQELVVSR